MQSIRCQRIVSVSRQSSHASSGLGLRNSLTTLATARSHCALRFDSHRASLAEIICRLTARTRQLPIGSRISDFGWFGLCLCVCSSRCSLLAAHWLIGSLADISHRLQQRVTRTKARRSTPIARDYPRPTSQETPTCSRSLDL